MSPERLLEYEYMTEDRVINLPAQISAWGRSLSVLPKVLPYSCHWKCPALLIIGPITSTSMSTSDSQYRLAPIEEGEYVRDEEGGPKKTGRTREEEDDSPLVFEFLKRKRPMPSARRLDYMLYVALDSSLIVKRPDG